MRPAYPTKCLPTRSADLHNERRRALIEGLWVFRFHLRLGVVSEAGHEDQHEQDGRGERVDLGQPQHTWASRNMRSPKAAPTNHDAETQAR